jgi:hypothetical protein
MRRIRDTGIYGANFSALGRGIRANALGTFAGINFIDGITLAYCLVRTFRLASTTANAII